MITAAQQQLIDSNLNTVVAHAKSINWNPETDNIMDLMKSWLQGSYKASKYFQDNNEAVLAAMKNMIN